MSRFGEREARLIPTLINVLVAGMCDPQRLNRGRTYARQGAVLGIQVEAGRLHGQVQGSRSEAYVVTVRVTAADAVDHLGALVPTAQDVLFECSCPDWEAPCKHAVALMSAFAERVGRNPQLLLDWRGADPAAPAQRATVGSRAAQGQASADLRADERASLSRFLGNYVAVDQEVPTPLAPPVGDEPWARMLCDALDQLRLPRRG